MDRQDVQDGAGVPSVPGSAGTVPGWYRVCPCGRYGRIGVFAASMRITQNALCARDRFGSADLRAGAGTLLVEGVVYPRQVPSH